MQGEPIKVGHHSEGAHRADIKKHDGHMTAALDEASKAEHYRRKAAGVGKAGISSDDPCAIEKLDAKLTQLVAERDGCKEVNAAWRKVGRPGHADPIPWVSIATMTHRRLESFDPIRRALALSGMGGQPYPRYVLTNLGANIKRVTDRLEELRDAQGREYTERQVGEITIVEDPDANRIRLMFPTKPDPLTRQTLRYYGFRWAPTEGAWQRHLNNAGRAAVTCVLGKLYDAEG